MSETPTSAVQEFASTDREIVAMRSVVATLEDLSDPAMTRRIVRYLEARYAADLPPANLNRGVT